MSTRRDALRGLAAAAAFPVLQGQTQPAAGPAHFKFFSQDDLPVLSKLVDAIIPRTDTPGATDAGVPLYIDRVSSNKADVGKAMLRGLAGLRKAGFAEASPDQLSAILNQLNDSSDPFFRLIKDLTIDGYYASREGLVTELGYHGDTFLSEFPGCTHPEHQQAKQKDSHAD
jgi:hypothetical protein